MTRPTTEEVWEQYHKMIYKVAGMVASKFSKPYDACLSESIWRVFTKLEKWDGERASLSTYVYSCAYFGAFDWASKKSKEICDTDLTPPHSDDEDLPSFLENLPSIPGFGSRMSTLSRDTAILVHITVYPPEVLAPEVALTRKVASRHAIEAYMIDELGWSRVRLQTAKRELVEWLNDSTQ